MVKNDCSVFITSTENDPPPVQSRRQVFMVRQEFHALAKYPQDLTTVGVCESGTFAVDTVAEPSFKRRLDEWCV